MNNKKGDFKVNDTIFEIGGANKTHHQIRELSHAFLVKDNIFSARAREIPLYYFGFLY